MESLNNEAIVSSQNDEHDVNIPELPILLYHHANAGPNYSTRVEHYFSDNSTTNDTLYFSVETSDGIDEIVRIIIQV